MRRNGTRARAADWLDPPGRVRLNEEAVPMMGWDEVWGVGDWLAMSLMMLMMVAFWGGLVALVVWLVRGSRDEGRREPPVEPARADEVLAQRFARGEIDEEEFTRRRELLRGQ